MCGIFGCINFSNKIIDKSKFNESLELLKHRGPDNQSTIYFNNDTIALGHRRLSIIDLKESANQPMKNDNYCIVFNGEIYNYIEIREDLISKGLIFLTDSDTEVILKSYEFYGESCVNTFNGMWAFVIYDIKNNTFFCSRDRFGVKPFNYYLSKETFIFSSEIKSIIKYDNNLNVPNYNSIGLYCLEGASSELNETWFENIFRLKPGHNLKINGSNITINRYYNYPNKSIDITFNEAKSKFRNLFFDSVRIRMRSDVPVGVTLSGGLDSSSIVAAISNLNSPKINSYTAKFPNYLYDEADLAKKTADIYNLNFNEINVEYSNDEYISLLNKMIYHLESGNLSPSIFPLWKVYERAKKDVTVVLEGQGADELLGGYMTTFSFYYLFTLLKNFRIKLFFSEFLKIFKNYSIKESFLLFIRTSFPFKIRSILRKYFFGFDFILKPKLRNATYKEKIIVDSNNLLHKALQISHKTTLSNLLHYGDAISMAFSIENRLPFIDFRIVDFCMKLNPSYLISNGKGKFIQRESLKEIIPLFIYEDTRKLGFPSPINNFLNENKKLLTDLLLSTECTNRNLFNEKILKKLINSDFSNKPHIARFLFRLISVELWFKIFIDKKI